MDKDISYDLEITCMMYIMDIFNGNEEAIGKLEEYINALWTVRTHVEKSQMSYNMLFAMHNYFENMHKNTFKKTSYIETIKIPTEYLDASFDLVRKSITVIDYTTWKLWKAELEEDEPSDELLDFIVDFFFKDVKIEDIKEFKHKEDLDLSGV